MPSPSYVGRLTRSEAGGTATTTIPVSAWADIHAGDLLLVFATSSSLVQALTVSGYTLIGSQGHPSGNPSAYLWGRIIGDPASEPDIVISWGSTATTRAVEVQAWTGGDPAAILDAAITMANGATGSVTTPEVSTVHDEARVIHFASFYTTSGAITLTGSAPFDTAVADALVAGASNVARQRAFSITKSPAGATGSATAAVSGGAYRGLGFLVPLKPGTPRGSSGVASTLAAAQDAVQGDVGEAFAGATAGSSAEWSYVPGPNEGEASVGATLAAGQDAAQADSGGSAAGATLGASASVVQTEVGAATGAATIGSSANAVQTDAGAAAAASTLAAVPDASYQPIGVVSYPEADTWQATILLGPGLTEVHVTDNLGATIVLHFDGGGIIPEPDNVTAHLGATAEPTYWTPGEQASASTLGAAQDARQNDADAPTAPVTLGVANDAEAMPPLVPRWLARAFRVAQSWVGGPYRRVPLDQFAWVADAAVALGVSEDGNFTPKDALADIPDAANTYTAAQDATFTIVEPKVIVSVNPILYGVTVHAIRLGRSVPAIRWAPATVAPHRLGISVEAHPLNVLVPARRRR